MPASAASILWPGVPVLGPLLAVTAWLWGGLEVGLLIRDRVRGKGGTSRDRGTRLLSVVTILAAVVLARMVAVLTHTDTVLRLPGAGEQSWLAVGLAVMWLGLALRLWAIVTLGRAFRTTVEVDAGQELVDRGPYRWIRHPSYTGLLIISTGYGLAQANYLSLAVTVLPPLAVVAWRIHVEEQALVATLGPAYLAYRSRTKRLIPALW